MCTKFKKINKLQIDFPQNKQNGTEKFYNKLQIIIFSEEKTGGKKICFSLQLFTNVFFSRKQKKLYQKINIHNIQMFFSLKTKKNFLNKYTLFYLYFFAQNKKL